MFQAHAIFYPDLLEEHFPLGWFIHLDGFAASPGSLEAEVGSCVSFKPVPWADISEQRRDCEPKPSAKTPTRFLLHARSSGTEPSKHCAVGGGRLQQSRRHVTGNLTRL